MNSRRRTGVIIGAAVVLVVAAAVGITRPWTLWSGFAVDSIGPQDPAVAQVEAARRTPQAGTVNVTLTAAPLTTKLGGRDVSTWAFNGQVPGPSITAVKGDTIRADVVNNLPDPLTVHWHGIALRNDMDGVPDLTQAPIAPGEQFTYEFTVPDAGTYFYHSHVGVQLDRGLYGPLVVDDRPGDGRDDVTLLLDDWIDGTGTTPEQVLEQLQNGAGGTAGGMTGMDHSGMGMRGMGPATADQPLGGDTADVRYPLYLVNGRTATDPFTYQVAPGGTVRVRLVNAGASTPFRVAASSGRLTVVASDGFDVRPVPARSLVIGMGERYDVLVTAPRSGTLWLEARPESGSGLLLAGVRSGAATSPPPVEPTASLDATPLRLGELHATEAATLPQQAPDRSYDVTLTGGMMASGWGLDTGGQPLVVRQGDRVRITLRNMTMMWHPIHLHGHTFQVVSSGRPGPRKDTVSIPPMSGVTIEFDADNPGRWMLHCHNVYHAESGMMTALEYLR